MDYQALYESSMVDSQSCQSRLHWTMLNIESLGESPISGDK